MTFPWLIQGDCLKSLALIPDEVVDLIITSPPYWGLKDYGCDGQMGQESTIEGYLGSMQSVFAECYRVLSRQGALFLNIGDTYFAYWGNSRCGDSLPPSFRTGYNENIRPKFKPEGWKKDKQKALIPFRVAINLQEQGWIVRNDITWNKDGCRPENVKNRMTCQNEYFFFCLKDARSKIFHRSGRIGSDLWTFPASRNPDHPATFPVEMVQEIIGATSAKVVMDPFMGTGSVGQAAINLQRDFIGIELNPGYFRIASNNIRLL